MYEKWLAMEEFYYKNLFSIGFVGSILAIIIISTILYIHRKWIRNLIVICFILILTMVVYGWREYIHHQPLIHIAERLNPAVRLFKRKPYYLDEEYQSYLVKHFQEVYLRAYFASLPMYEAHQHIEEIIYHGQDDRGQYYIEVNSNIYTPPEDLVEISQDIGQPQRIGNQYILKDLRFKEIGFIESSSIFLLKYQIPESQRGIKFTNSTEIRLHNGEFPVGQWIVPGEKIVEEYE